MIELPDGITDRDVGQWLNNGVCLVDRDTPAYYHGPADGGYHVETVDGEQIIIPRNERDRIAAHWPRCGALNVGNVAIFLQRTQQQQYRRTYNPRSLSVVLPNKWDVLRTDTRLVRAVSNPMHPPVVRAAFHPQYPDWDTAMDKLRDGAIGVAINSHIILAGKPRELTVYHRGRKAGLVLDGRYVPGGRALSNVRAFKLLQGRVTL